MILDLVLDAVSHRGGPSMSMNQRSLMPSKFASSKAHKPPGLVRFTSS